MISLKVILLIIAIHWVADFLLQNRWMADNKSKSWRALFIHTAVYTLATAVLWLLTGIIMPVAAHITILMLLTFILHTATDFITSRVSLSLWHKGKTRAFFNIIGFDQLLHHFQLYTTYYLCWYDVPVA